MAYIYICSYLYLSKIKDDVVRRSNFALEDKQVVSMLFIIKQNRLQGYKKYYTLLQYIVPYLCSNLDYDTSTLIPNSQSDFFSCSSADCKARQGTCSGEVWRHKHFDIFKFILVQQRQGTIYCIAIYCNRYCNSIVLMGGTKRYCNRYGGRRQLQYYCNILFPISDQYQLDITYINILLLYVIIQKYNDINK